MANSTAASLKEALRKRAAMLDWADQEHARADALKSADQRFAETVALCEFSATQRPEGITIATKEETTPTRWKAIAEAWLRKSRSGA